MARRRPLVRAAGKNQQIPAGDALALAGALDEAPISTLAGASTVAIGAALGNTLQITGSTAITAFDTAASGAMRRLVFSGVLTLVHDSSKLILPGGANIVTAPGDVATFLSLGSGNWRCVDYSRASGAAVLPASNPNLLINSAFTFNQRAFKGGSLSAGAYGHDRWGAYNGGCSYSVAGSTITLNSGTLCQVIENAALGGMVVTFSIENPSGALTVTLGSTSANISAGSGRVGVTMTVPSDQSGDLKVRLSGSNVSFARPKLEMGRQATQWSPPDQALERARCLRYYEKSYLDKDAPGTKTTDGYVNWFLQGSVGQFSYNTSFSQQKRALPALTIYSHFSGAAGKVYDVTNSVDTDARPAVGVNGFRNYFIPASGSAINLGHHYVADAELACTD